MSFRLPRRTTRTSGAMYSDQKSHETPSASQASETLSASLIESVSTLIRRHFLLPDSGPGTSLPGAVRSVHQHRTPTPSRIQSREAGGAGKPRRTGRRTPRSNANAPLHGTLVGHNPPDSAESGRTQADREPRCRAKDGSQRNRKLDVVHQASLAPRGRLRRTRDSSGDSAAHDMRAEAPVARPQVQPDVSCDFCLKAIAAIAEREFVCGRSRT
jgi:hypothetical protein